MLGSWIKALTAPNAPYPPPKPEAPFVVLGDLHGRADLLEKTLSAVLASQIVCVGDYVDRGEHSADVLRLLQARPDIICLSGNHEEMMLGFVDYPQQYGPRWLRNGGLQTLASFGIAGASEGSTGAALDQIAEALRAAMGDDLIQWLRQRPAIWQSGNVAVAHAGADPKLPMGEQTTQTLHWGHADFARVERRDGLWVVHGHTIVAAPVCDRGRISIDTGAYATGRLTAALIMDGRVEFDAV
jgi:serine/threonine protein phosphatase 1